ncbi:MAG: thioesterase [Solibacteraceae bacterium]|nr:thioesterase [Solibacteraceae bacterium]
MQQIPPGTSGEHRILVTPEVAFDFLGSEDARVLSTPHLIALLEMTARNTIQPLLDAGEGSVGTEVHVRHLGAVPMGLSVVFRAVVTGIEGRRVRFAVEASDETGVVAEPREPRAICDLD